MEFLVTRKRWLEAKAFRTIIFYGKSVFDLVRLRFSLVLQMYNFERKKLINKLST